jgi:hypothetical protein
MRRRKALTQLEAELPPPSGNVETPDARTAVSDIAQLVERDDVSRKDFFEGDNPLGLEIQLQPDRDAFLALDASYGTEQVHEEAVRRVRNAVSNKIRGVAADKLREFRLTLVQKERVLADQIQSILCNDAPLAVSLESAVQYCDRLSKALQPLEVEGRGEDVSDLVRETIDRRETWVSREDTLWQDGSRVPARLVVGICTALIAAGAALLGFVAGEVFVRLRGVSEAWAYAITIAAAAGAAFFYWTAREGWVRAYFERWRQFEDDIRGFMSSLAARLAVIANRRLRGMKSAALPTLSRALHAVRVRLQTERGGLRTLIRNEMEAISEDEPEKPYAGWFRVSAIDVPSEVPPSATDEFRQLLRPIVELHDWPRPLEIKQHLKKIDDAIEQCCANVQIDRDAATRRIVDAVHYARDGRINPDFEDNRTFTMQRVSEVRVFAPAILADADVGAPVMRWGVPELVVVSNVQSYALKAVED